MDVATTILAVSGSLRAESTNSRLLRAAAALAPEGSAIVISEALARLPHFNPDLDGEGAVPPATVAAWRAEVGAAAALIVSTPEYAHGIPGSLKNALDWLVSSPEIIGKRVAVVNASARSTFADASLRETLRTMSAIVVEEASVTIPLDGRRLTTLEILSDRDAADALRSAISALLQA